MPTICLASGSPYRRELLSRVLSEFTVAEPGCEESLQPGETADSAVRRLAQAKARAASTDAELVIGSDQLATLDAEIVGKPLDPRAAIEQLARASGRRVRFHTGLCLLDRRSDSPTVDAVVFDVVFRKLSHAEIERYVARDQPLDCAGSFKAESLGISLFERMHGEDPSALIGLPLIRLCGMLRAHGVAVP